jgi:hypothetical protein
MRRHVMLLAVGLMLVRMASPAAVLAEEKPASEIVGIWNFHRSEGDKVPNSRPQGGGLPAVLKEFDAKHLEKTDAELADFTVARTGLQRTVKAAKSGWATFKELPDNGLLAKVNTPVGERALAIFCDKPGNWVHFPGLATELVSKPGGSVRSFGIAAWYLLQTEGEKPRFVGKHGINCLLRLSQVDARLQTFDAVDRFYTEDVGNGLGPKKAYRLPGELAEAACARWVHVVVSGDGAANKFQMWVNGRPVRYVNEADQADAHPWPAPGGLEINYKKDHDSDGGVIGRWLGGSGASGRTMGLAAVVIVKGTPIDQKKAAYLYELGRRGIPFDGKWFSMDLADCPKP